MSCYAIYSVGSILFVQLIMAFTIKTKSLYNHVVSWIKEDGKAENHATVQWKERRGA